MNENIFKNLFTTYSVLGIFKFIFRVTCLYESTVSTPNSVTLKYASNFCLSKFSI